MKKYVFVALTFLVLGIVFLTAITNKYPLHIYLLPENFVGEVEVTFDQADSPPLPKERNSYIYNIPGIHIASMAGRNLKKTTLELGRNSSFIILVMPILKTLPNAAVFGKFLQS